MVKESKYFDEKKVGLIFMLQTTIWLSTFVLAEVPRLHESSIWRKQYVAVAAGPNGRVGARARSSPLAALIIFLLLPPF